MADLNLTDQNFENEVLKSDIPVVVDFWAEWCVPCRIVSPTIDELVHEYAGKVKVAKMDVDHTTVSQNYGIMSIPTVMLFKNGQPVKSMVGAQSKENYKREIDAALAS